MSTVRLPEETNIVKNAAPELLVVDGNAHQGAYHALMLQRFEYRVVTASSMREALGTAAVASPSLVITELDLPDGSGYELLRQLRQNAPTARLQVIALSLSGDHSTEARCLRAGFAAYLGAPAQAEDLYRTVKAVLEPAPRRQGMRIQAKMPVFVNEVPLDCVEGECASVISEHGMYIRTHRPHPRNARVDIRIDLEGRSIAAEAVVLYSHRFGEGPFGEPGMGLKFARIAAQDQEYLRDFVLSGSLLQ